MKKVSSFQKLDKVLFFVLFMLFTSYTGYSQNHFGFEYAYDDAGNRIQRMYIILKSGETASTITKEPDTAFFIDRGFDLEFVLHPNPTKGVVKIDISGGNNAILTFSLYSLQGSLINIIQRRGSSVIIDLSNQPPGMYILVCILNNQQKEWKIIKE
jgi:hypothetical protein